MLIWRLEDWRVESDGYISGQQLAQLDDVRALRRANQQLAAREAARLAERVRSAKRRALRRGYQAGRAAALHDLVMPAAAATYAMQRLKESLVQIVMKAVAEIVGELPPAAILPNQLRHSLLAARDQHLLSLRVATCDFADACEAIGAIERELGLAIVAVLADADLPPRSCIVETDGGVIDGGLRHQLAALERGMRDAISAVLAEYTRLDDGLLRQFDVVAQGLRDTLDVLGAPVLTPDADGATAPCR